MACDDVIERLEKCDWFQELDKEERESVVHRLRVDPRASEFAERVFDELEEPQSPWRKLSSSQVKAQVLGAVERYDGDRKQRQSLKNLEWYAELAPKTQNDVERTVLSMLNLVAVTPRPKRRVEEEQIAASNPWSRLLQRP